MSVSDNSHPVACYSVLTAADPSAMPRVLEIFALRSVVPARWHGARIDGGTGDPADDRLAIDLQVPGLAPETAAMIGRKLDAMACVTSVLLTEKRAA